MTLRARFQERVHRQHLDGHARIVRQRRLALFLIITAMMRAAAWTTLIVLYLVHVPFTASLFKSVAFVAVISLYANAATDFGQGAASLSQLAAIEAHYDAEAARIAVGVDYQAIDTDIAQLAELNPGPEAQELATRIRSKFVR